MDDSSPTDTVGVHWIDFVVVAVMMVVSVGIGIYQALSGGRQRTTEEYLVGNRQMRVLPVALSLMVTNESSIMMLGNPAESYLYGIQILLLPLGGTIANIIVGVMIIPVIHRLKITSINEYYMGRFHSLFLRRLCVVLGMLSTMWYMGIVMFGSATAIEAALGIEIWKSITIVGICAVIYTTIGGYKAVIWTDVFQAVVMFAGIFAILIKGTMDVGGVAEVYRQANDGGRLKLFELSPLLRQSFWGLIFGTAIRFLYLGCNQATVQRVNSTPTLSDARKVIWMMMPPFIIVNSLAILEGTVAFAYYHQKGCDPLESGQIKNPNQIIPYLVMDLFRNYPGVSGLFYASLLSAVLSTLSSGLSGISAMFWEDIAKPIVGAVSQYKATTITKISVFVTGILSMAVSFLVAHAGGTLLQITWTVLASFSAPKIGIFMTGMICPWANARSTILAAVCAFGICSWYAIGNYVTDVSFIRESEDPLPGVTHSCPDLNITQNNTVEPLTFTSISTLNLTVGLESEREPTWVERFYAISFHYPGPIGIVSTVCLASIFSLFCGHVKRKESDHRYVTSFTDAFFCCLPNSWLKCLRCGYERSSLSSEDHDDKVSSGYDAPVSGTFEKLDQFPVPYDLPPFYERVIDAKDKSPVFVARFDPNKETVILE